jgi:DNA-binding CsgD family transcriptional regulator
MDEYFIYHKNSLMKLEQTYKNICNQLGVEQFGYTRVYFNSSHFFIGDNNELIVDLINNVKSDNIYFKQFAGKENFNGKVYYYTIWPDLPSSISMDYYVKHNYWNGMTVSTQNADSIDAWWVASNSLNLSINHIYQQESFRKKLLISIDYFNKQKDTLLEPFDIKYMPKYIEGFDFDLPFNPEINSIENFKYEKEQLLKCYYPKGITIKSKNGVANLSKAQILVLGFLAQGYSAKEIASTLGNSAKTIEYHKEKVKLKTGYNLTSDLVKLYNNQLRFLVE